MIATAALSDDRTRLTLTYPNGHRATYTASRGFTDEQVSNALAYANRRTTGPTESHTWQRTLGPATLTARVDTHLPVRVRRPRLLNAAARARAILTRS